MAVASIVRNEPSPLHAVVGVWHRADETYYVKRSSKMKNYPGVWSLLSIQYRSGDMEDSQDLFSVRRLMARMSRERLGGVPIRVNRHLTSGDSDHNPYNLHVHLHLYDIELEESPVLNPAYYTQGAWLTAEEYQRRSADRECGLCLRLWSDYAWLAGIMDRPFIPREPVTP